MKKTMTKLPYGRLGLYSALALAGCALGPDYQRPSVTVPASYKQAEAFEGWKVAEPQDERPRGKWWEGYNDPVLSRLVEDSLAANQNVVLAEARYRQAQAFAQTARAALFPTVSANASTNRSKRSGNAAVVGSGRIIDNHAIGLSANWEVDLWGRLRRQRESSLAAEQASAADLEVMRLSVAATVAQHYFQLRILDTMQKLLDDTVAAFAQSLQLTSNRYDAGVAARSDVVQSETLLKSTQSQAIDNRLQRTRLEHAIAVLCGKSPAELSLPAAPYLESGQVISASLPEIPSSLPSSLLERRPDVAAAERRVAAANAAIGVAKSAFFPTLEIAASAGYQSQNFTDLISTPTRVWAIGPALAAAIFDGGLRRAQTQAAIADHEASIAIYRQAVLTGFQEVEDSLAALGLLSEQASVQQDAVKFARESVQQTLNRYKAGTIDYLNVVTVQATALNNEREALLVEGQRLVASIDLIRALGGGWQGGEPNGTVSLNNQ